MSKVRRLRLSAAVAAVAALAAVSAGGTASADSASKAPAPVKTITMRGNANNEDSLRFEGAKSIRQDALLRIRNATNPEEIGPHTFSLVKGSEIPKTKRQIKKCGDFDLPICASIVFDWHLVDFSGPQPVVNQPLSDERLEGWDKPGDRDTIGDSWVAQAQGETLKAPVSSSPRTLRYFCVVHPTMKGKLEVTPAQ